MYYWAICILHKAKFRLLTGIHSIPLLPLLVSWCVDRVLVLRIILAAPFWRLVFVLGSGGSSSTFSWLLPFTVSSPGFGESLGVPAKLDEVSDDPFAA